MDNTISKIIKEIKPNYCFDVHTIISILIENYSDIYLSNFSGYSSTHGYHAKIALIISKFEGTLVEKQESESWSKNIHNNYSNCSLWKRI